MFKGALQKALIKQGHKHELVVKAEKKNSNKRKRKHILYFNPTFAQWLEQKSVKNSLKFLAETLTQGTIKFLIGNC